MRSPCFLNWLFKLRVILATLVLGYSITLSLAVAERQTQNIILISLDGVRVEEMFGGVNTNNIRESLKNVTNSTLEESNLYKKYWAPTSEARREKLMPFFWGTWMKQHGSIVGNRDTGSIVQVSNRHRFSYPGYSEILTGEAHDDLIKSNDKIQNPTPTVLEFLKKELNLSKEKVAAFCSWDVFDFIAESKPGSITINCGYSPYGHPDPEIQRLSRMQKETITPWDSVRHDAYTFRFAMAHLKTYRPRVLYLGLGETDDWSHDKRYDRVLHSLQLADDYFRQLWEFLQSDEQYKDKTTVLITTDHGRGNNEYSWPNHGAQIEGAQYIWIAAVSPESKLRGEWKNAEPLYQNQVAATLCESLGLNYNKERPKAGQPIQALFKQ